LGIGNTPFSKNSGFYKPRKDLVNEIKKNLHKPEIFPHESNLTIYKSENSFVLECVQQIIFYYKGGDAKLKEDFSNSN